MPIDLSDDDELTALVDPDIPRVDLVGKGANGIPRFLLAKRADGPAGLLAADYVRDLIAKADPPPTDDGDVVTMSGSPAAIAKLIHAAAVRAVEPEPVEKAKYNADDRKRMAGHEAMDDGGYPIADREDLDNAIHAVGRGGADHDAIRRHIASRAKALGASSEIPDNWNADGSLKGPVSKEVGVADDMDPVVALAEPDGDSMPGSEMDPGSPAWEAVDAASAQKWTSILARARAAICLLAEREMLEAASSSGDADDGMNAMDLEDACCAIDYAIGVLAPFAVAEQTSAETGADEMQGMAKALAEFDARQLDTIEAFAAVRKAGRVLSASNEAAIRGAVDALQKVLASLPQAPAAPEAVEKVAAANPTQPSADAKEMDMPTTESSAEAVTHAGQQPEMGTAQPTTPAAGPEFPVAKADGEKAAMAVVYTQTGKLLGIVDPKDITPVVNSEAEPDEPDDEPDGDGPDGADGDGMDGAAQTPDLTPAPAGEVGTPADAVADGVTKETTNVTSDEVLKGIADVVKQELGTFRANQEEVIAKQAADLATMTQTIEVLKGQVERLEEQPAVPKVFTNGAVPPQHQLRGQDQGTGRHSVDIAKAREMKQELYHGDASRQRQVAEEMNGLAIVALHDIHQRRG